MSFSTKFDSPATARDEKLKLTLIFTEISVALYRKHYPNANIYFITDTIGKEIFKNIDFTKTFDLLEVVPEKYKDVWSLSKLYAMKHIASLGEPFFHSDNDFLLLKPFSKNIIDAEIVVQSVERSSHKRYYPKELFRNCKNKYLASFIELDAGFNCGLIGGKNCSFLYEYANTAIKMIEDPENDYFWREFENMQSDSPKFLFKFYGTKALIAEQYYLACCLYRLGIIPELMYDNDASCLIGSWTDDLHISVENLNDYSQKKTDKFMHLQGRGKYDMTPKHIEYFKKLINND